MTITVWFLWALILIAQNFSFTWVSRARNSGSLAKHLVAGIFSNGIWFASQLVILTAMLSLLKGEHGILPAIGTGVYYTVFTLTGSLLAHQIALKTEKGKSAVGANNRFAQISIEEWNQIKSYFNDKSTPIVDA